MRLLFISALEIKEKGAQSIRMTLEGYAKAGHDITLVTSKKPFSRDYYYEKEYVPECDNFKIVRLWLPLGYLASKSGKLNRLRELYIFGLIAFFWGLGYSLKGRPDIYYGYEVRGILPSFLLSRIFKRPLVSRFQGTILEPIIREKDTNKRAWRRVWDHRLAFRLSADKYIMTNDGTLGDVVFEYFGVPKEKSHFWMNGVNKGLYQPKLKNYIKDKYKLPKDSTILLTVSRLTSWKRTDRAIKSMVDVLKANKAVYLVVVGDGERGEELKQLAKSLGVSKNVIFVGGVANTEIAGYLNGADIYLGTFDLSNAGNPLFEAMLAGLAIVSMDNGSTKSFLDNGRAGILAKNDSQFTAEIVRLLEDKSKIKEQAEKARVYSHKNFWTWPERIKTEISEVSKLSQK